MSVKDQANSYIDSQPEPKRCEMRALHERILETFPGCKLWFTDGKDEKGKVVANPNIGYGSYTIKYADGKTKEFYRIGLSANTTGFSVYVLGLEDKTYLSKTFGKTIGKASVTGYCIKFKTLANVDIDVLMTAIRAGYPT